MSLKTSFHTELMLFSRLLPLFREHWMRLLSIAVISIIIGAFPTIKSGIESVLVEGVTARNSTESAALVDFAKAPNRIDLGADDTLTGILESVLHRLTLGQIFITFLFVTLAGYTCDYLKKSMVVVLQKKAFSGLRQEAFENALTREPSEVPDKLNPAGSATEAINKGASSVSTYLGNLLDTFSDVAAIAGIVFSLFSVGVWFAGVAIGLVFTLVAVSRLQAARLKRDRAALDGTKNELSGRTDDIISHKEIVLAFEMQEHFSRVVSFAAEQYAALINRLKLAEERYSLGRYGIRELGRVGILFAIAVVANLTGNVLLRDVSAVYFVLSLYTRLYHSTDGLLENYNESRRLEGTIGTFFALLETKRSMASDLEVVTAEMLKNYPERTIEFKDVSFRYPGHDSPALRNTSFSVPQGSTALLLGRSGSGKTTIGRLLLGFWRPTSGLICIGGKETTQETPQRLRTLISYVAQDQHVVDESVRENLKWSFSARKAPDQQLIEMLERLGLVSNPNEGLGMLAKPAKQLSGGQKQRVAIGRMLLDDSPIVVLDEPLSGADIHTIRELFPIFQRELKQTSKTVLLITHQMCLAEVADYAVVLGDEGRVVEQGKIAELKTRPGEFCTLYNAARAALGA